MGETRAAYKVLGHGTRSLPLFRWPPVRPSYLPFNHCRIRCKLQCGGACPPNCNGRRGDQEILKWVRAARHKPIGKCWTKIPLKGDRRNQQPSLEDLFKK